jgi:Rrf2 family protein
MRLELSVRTDLSLRALQWLAASGGRVARSDLAETLGPTPGFLARVMSPLVRQEWVDSKPGRNGGYRLTRRGRSTSVLDVIELQEGIPTSRCVLRFGPCNSEERCALHDPWTKARDAMLAELATATAIGGWKEER